MQREETVVLEFDRDLPKTGFITLSFHDPVTGEQLSSVPTAQLGTRTLKAISPGRCGRLPVKCKITWLIYTIVVLSSISYADLPNEIIFFVSELIYCI